MRQRDLALCDRSVWLRGLSRFSTNETGVASQLRWGGGGSALIEDTPRCLKFAHPTIVIHVMMCDNECIQSYKITLRRTIWPS